MREDLAAALRAEPRLRDSLGACLRVAGRDDLAVLLADVPGLAIGNHVEVGHGGSLPRSARGKHAGATWGGSLTQGGGRRAIVPLTPPRRLRVSASVRNLDMKLEVVVIPVS